MRVFIAGVDGYLGWSLAQYLATRGHHVGGCDNGNRRKWVAEVGGQSIIPIAEMRDRLPAFQERYGYGMPFAGIDLCDYNSVQSVLRTFKPDCVVHLGEIPSAPFSMIDAQHACLTHRNNLEGTLNILWAMREVCPNAHLLKLGTMGEFGTPNVDIPEGMFELEFRGRKDRVMFPRKAGSFYHLTKVHDTHNVEFACRNWGLRSTDIMQGVVFGTRIPEMDGDDRLATRFDVDSYFGTAINRFCAQVVIGHPITIYGGGGQQRGFLPLQDSMQCLTLVIENPPQSGEYRVFNQFENVYDLTALALAVRNVARELGIEATINSYENPRREAEQHYYNPDRSGLLELGYQPTQDIEDEILSALRDLLPHRGRIEQIREVLIPMTKWDGTKHRSQVLREVAI